MPLNVTQAARLIHNTNRARVFNAFGRREKSPAQIAREIDMPVNLVAYHVGVLAKAGAVELVRTAPRRGSTEHFYRARVSIHVTEAGPAVFQLGKSGPALVTPAHVAIRSFGGR